MSSFLSQTVIIILLNTNININGQYYSCNDALQCANQSIYSNNINCNGALSCYSASMTSNITTISNIYCHGANACSDVQQLFFDKIWCTASNSCRHSDIVAESTLHCYGHLSCAFSYIITRKVEARASYALYQAVIESDLALDVHLNGYYSGFGANITCHSNDTCKIYCYSNGCYMMYLNCHNNAQCIIHNGTPGAIRPITNISLLDLTPNTMHSLESAQCDTNVSMTFDIAKERYNSGTIIINDSMCCRGGSSCQITTIVHVGDLFCSGYSSCRQSNITTNNPMFCLGYYACGGSTSFINITNDIFCLGYWGCGYANIYNAINITCSGDSSCAYTHIYTSGLGAVHNVYFTGSNAAWDSVIHCRENDKCFILCATYWVCQHTTVICDGECSIECGGSFCPNATGSVTYTQQPTTNPTLITYNPTLYPTTNPSNNPTMGPTNDPTFYPSYLSTFNPVIFDPLSSMEISMQETLYTKIEETKPHLDFYIAVVIISFISVFVIIYVLYTYFNEKKTAQQAMIEMETQQIQEDDIVSEPGDEHKSDKKKQKVMRTPVDYITEDVEGGGNEGERHEGEFIVKGDDETDGTTKGETSS